MNFAMNVQWTFKTVREVFLFKKAIAQLSITQGIFQAQKGMEPFYISLKKSIAEANEMKEKWEGTLDPIFKDSITISNMKSILYFSVN